MFVLIRTNTSVKRQFCFRGSAEEMSSKLANQSPNCNPFKERRNRSQPAAVTPTPATAEAPRAASEAALQRKSHLCITRIFVSNFRYCVFAVWVAYCYVLSTNSCLYRQ